MEQEWLRERSRNGAKKLARPVQETATPYGQ
jgi:hypothetical protein